MKTLLSALVLLSSLNAYSQSTLELAVVKRAPVMNLGAIDIPDAEIVDLKKDENGAIKYAKLKINVQLKPQGCDMYFLKNEIIAQVGHLDRWGDNPTQTIDFGTLQDIGVGSACPAVPARPATITVVLVNGVGASFGEDRTINVLVKAIDPDDTLRRDAYWDIVIPLNQKSGKINIDTITLFTKK